MKRRSPILLLIVLVVLFFSQSAESASGRAPARAVPPGVWGGDHIRMDVSLDGAEIEFDCARGTISAPLTLDAQGRFQVKGIYKRDTPAPAAAGADAGANAVYSGTLKGGAIHLELSVSGQSAVQSFNLVQGDQGTLTKCA